MARDSLITYKTCSVRIPDGIGAIALFVDWSVLLYKVGLLNILDHVSQRVC